MFLMFHASANVSFHVGFTLLLLNVKFVISLIILSDLFQLFPLPLSRRHTHDCYQLCFPPALLFSYSLILLSVHFCFRLSFHLFFPTFFLVCSIPFPWLAIYLITPLTFFSPSLRLPFVFLPISQPFLL